MKIIKISTELEMTIHDFPEGTMREQNKVLCELIGNGSTTVTTDGDTCGFDIEVIDLDSAEHIYLNYYFQFSTIVAASGE